MFGGVLLLVAAVFGAVVLPRNAERLTLIGLTFVFPAGYFFWWATKLSGSTALNGLGPHYYLPSFIPIAALAAYGLTRLLDRRQPLLVVLAVLALVGATAWSVPDKYQRESRCDEGVPTGAAPRALGPQSRACFRAHRRAAVPPFGISVLPDGSRSRWQGRLPRSIAARRTPSSCA